MIEFDKNLTATVRHIEAGVEVVKASTTAKIGKNAIRFDNCAQGMALDVQLSNDAIEDFSSLGSRPSRNLLDTKSGISYIKFLNADGAERARYGWVLDLPPGDYRAHAEDINYTSGYIEVLIVNAENNQMVSDAIYLANGTTVAADRGAFTLAEGQRALLLDYTSTHTQEQAEKLLYEDVNLQVEAGSLATVYEPYGDVPGGEVRQYGKNLFDYKQVLLMPYYWNSTTGKLTTSNNYSCSMLIPCTHLRGKTITQNEAIYDVASGSSAGVVFYTTNAPDAFIKGAGGNGHTYTVPMDAEYMGITVPRAFADGTGVQIELGDTETAFEFYKDPIIAKATKSGAVNGLVTNATNTLFVAGAGDVDITIEASYTIESAGESYFSQDDLKSITLERLGESKFFGFGVCQKANIKLLDRGFEKSFTTSDKFNISFDGLKISPQLRVSEVHRDETTGELSITVYDALKAANDCVVNDINLTTPYNLADVARVIASKIKVGIVIPALDEFNLSFENGANFDGAETLREVLNAIAEATQTMYFINRNNELVFKRLSAEAKQDLLYITAEDYFSFDNSTNRRLTAIVSATELGDNYEAHTGQIGTTQYVRNNPFWELREDLPQLVDKAIEVMGNFTIPQFECSWRGNYLLEPGDWISVGSIHNQIYALYINDSLEYDGGLSAKTYWEYTDEEAEHSNPTNLGEALKQTYAKVDKANKQIDIVVSEIASNDEEISQLQMTTGTIELSVSSLQETTTDAIDGINSELAQLNEKASLSVKKDEIEMIVQSQISNGVASVETTTGFRFDDEGLTISKSNSDISTTITEDGMQVEDGNKKLLIANHEGVKAEDLHATTYLIVGKYSRFEDYGSSKRTACFWIGG
jgi:hypothetical protein